MKKQLLFLVSTLSLVTLIGCNKNEEEYQLITNNSIKYIAFNGENRVAMVVGYESNLPSEVSIPESINGYTVNAIRHESFVNANISKITIPESIAYIGYRAFAECLNLKEVSLPNSISLINQNTFAECDSLENITIPESVSAIRTGAFLGCDNLKSISLPSNLLSIGSYAFYNCESLANIYLPDSLLSIDDYAFSSCTSLDKVFIPSSVSYIGKEVFSNNIDNFKILLGASELPSSFSSNFNCYYPYALGTNRNTALSDVFITDNNINYAINNYETSSPTASLTSPSESASTSITVPDKVTYQNSKTANVTSITNYAFMNDSKIDTIDFSSATNLKTVGKYAFANSSLKSVTFNTNIESLDEYSFAMNENLTSIDLSGTNVTNIGYGAFYYDYNITDIKLPSTDGNSLKLGRRAFEKCRKLNSITNLEKITKLDLEGHTFAECYNLGTNINNPFLLTSNITTIYPTDFLDWGTTQNQFIKISKDAYKTEEETGDIYLTANGGDSIKLEKVDESTYKNNLYFSNAIILLEPKS